MLSSKPVKFAYAVVWAWFKDDGDVEDFRITSIFMSLIDAVASVDRIVPDKEYSGWDPDPSGELNAVERDWWRPVTNRLHVSIKEIPLQDGSSEDRVG